MKNKWFILLFFMMFCFIPSTSYAQSGVEIDSIDLLEKSDSVVENSESNFQGMNLSFDLSMKNTGDYAKYKVIIKNKNNTKYRININLSDVENKYFKYSVEFENESTVLNEYESKTMFITIQYVNDIPFDVMTNGVYRENSKVVLQLDNNEFHEIENPYTFHNLLCIILVLIIVCVVLFLLFNRKSRIHMILLLFIIPCLLPLSVIAIEELSITIDSEITVDKSSKFGFFLNNEVVEFDYTQGMSINDYYFSKPENNVFSSLYGSGCYGVNFNSYGYNQCLIDNDNNYEQCLDFQREIYPSKESLILSSDLGFYQIYHCCLDGESIVEVYDKKKKKRRKKKLKDVTYDDLLLVWNFDEGCFDWAKPLWIKERETVPQYTVLTFSDGSILKVIGDHRIFSCDSNSFVKCIDDLASPIGMRTFNAEGKIIKLISKEIIHSEIDAYNVITNYHINVFANGIITSWGINNYYPIKDMKFVKENVSYNERDDFSDISDYYFDGLRIKEISKNYKGNKEITYQYINDLVQKLIRKKKD